MSKYSDALLLAFQPSMIERHDLGDKYFIVQ